MLDGEDEDYDTSGSRQQPRSITSVIPEVVTGCEFTIASTINLNGTNLLGLLLDIHHIQSIRNLHHRY